MILSKRQGIRQIYLTDASMKCFERVVFGRNLETSLEVEVAMEASVENIILRHSHRGMDRLVPYMPENFCKNTARRFMEKSHGTVIIATGFYVAGYAETDGPVGTYFLAGHLKKMGFEPVIITDKYCEAFFDEIPVIVAPLDADRAYYEGIIEQYSPVCCISVERCGRNAEGDYTNMRMKSIKADTAGIDLLFEEATARNIYTIGIGDGGNEIGMGNLENILSEDFSIKPSHVKVDSLIIATVSNWGAYGLMACLDIMCGTRYFPTYHEVKEYIRKIVLLGSVDGVTGEHTCTVDGYAAEIEKEIIEGLRMTIR